LKRPLEVSAKMVAFDQNVIMYLNGVFPHSVITGRLVEIVCSSNLFKGGIFMAFYWWLWFRPDEGAIVNRNRKIVVLTLLGVFLALFIVRVLIITAPFRFRPLDDPRIVFQLPFQFVPVVGKWSSFPSDHAALFTGLAAGIWFVYRRLFYIAIAYVFLVIMSPRLFLGLHYPTDLLAGALLGLACVLVCLKLFMNNRLLAATLSWGDQHKGIFYSFFFLVTFQLAVLFDDVRYIGGMVFKMLH
jgi:undecaprenyl-diphosphatase